MTIGARVKGMSGSAWFAVTGGMFTVFVVQQGMYCFPGTTTASAVLWSMGAGLAVVLFIALVTDWARR
jgi:hypothetical protein